MDFFRLQFYASAGRTPQGGYGFIVLHSTVVGVCVRFSTTSLYIDAGGGSGCGWCEKQ